jgi:stage II sporulation protein P
MFKEVTSDMSLDVYKSENTYLSFLIDNEVVKDVKDGSPVFKMMTSMFPIQQYTLQEKMQMVMNGESNSKEDEEFLAVMHLMSYKDYQDDSNTDSMYASDDQSKEQAILEGVPFIMGESYFEQDSESVISNATVDDAILNKINTLEKDRDYSFLVKNFFIVDKTTHTSRKVFDVDKLLDTDMTIDVNSDQPQILIYHTHASEAFSDSREGVTEDTVVGVGDYLTDILENEYGMKVIHDRSVYDMMGGTFDRGSKAYEYSLEGITKILKDNPSIKVTIDLHRDSGNDKIVTKINGKETAQVMLFNGLSTQDDDGEEYLTNKNLQGNLAFSLQLQIQALKMYPDFMKKIYLKGYRFNLHLVPRALLVELGNDKNTVEEAKNAMEPFAKILYQVLSGEEDTKKE